MENSLQYREKFELILRRYLRLVAADEPIPFDANLVAMGLDSLGTINLLLDIENAFAVELPGALLTPETFRTRETLERVVARLTETA